MRLPALIAPAALAVLLAGCGSSSGSGTTPTVASSLVTKVDHATADEHGKLVTASVDVTYGGDPGRKYVLRYGIVDAVSGLRASQSERVLAHITTTRDVISHTYSVTFNPHTPTDYIVHFALATPNGVFVASDDTDVFTYQPS